MTTPIAEFYGELVKEDMNNIVVYEQKDKEFLNRDAFNSSESRIGAAAIMATRRANNWLSLTDAYYARDVKGLNKTTEIKLLESQLDDALIKKAVELAAWWSV